jgi:deoxyribodipyrimidine photo-lyase
MDSSSPLFPTTYADILARVDSVDPIRYAATRNFIDGAVTRLSPYLSRGVITLPQVVASVLQRGYVPERIEKFLQELAWREYYQRVWQHLGDGLFNDIRQPQQPVRHRQMVSAIADAQTGIHALDEQVKLLYETGYMHNHVRMYVAAIACNLAQAHWAQPSRWMYYHLLDGDLASNTCSWQWVAGSFASKKYIANQENINKYLYTDQRHTFLDQSYDALMRWQTPEVLMPETALELVTVLPEAAPLRLDVNRPLLLYNSYHLNVEWRRQEAANRVLVLEPSHFQKYPVSEKVIAFILALSKNITGMQVFVGEVNDLPSLSVFPAVISVAHPTTQHYPGQREEGSWLFPEVKGYCNSFSAYWKKTRPYLFGKAARQTK